MNIPERTCRRRFSRLSPEKLSVVLWAMEHTLEIVLSGPLVSAAAADVEAVKDLLEQVILLRVRLWMAVLEVPAAEA